VTQKGQEKGQAQMLDPVISAFISDTDTVRSWN